MSVTGNTVFPVPATDSAVLYKGFGLVLANAAMYGMEHAVTAESLESLFARLVDLLDLYGEIEWGMCDEGLMLNGNPVDSSRGAAPAFVEQMRRGNILSFAFCPPLDRREFGMFMSIFSAKPGSALIEDGADAALVRAGFKSIRADKAVYERVRKKEIPTGAVKPGAVKTDIMRPTQAGTSRDSGKKRVFDLDSDFLALDNVNTDDSLHTLEPGGYAAAAQAARYLEQRNEVRRQRAGMVDMVCACAGDPSRLDRLHQQLVSCGFSPGEWHSLLQEAGIAEERGLGPSKAPLQTLLRRVEQMAAEMDAGGEHVKSTTEALETIEQEVDLLIRGTRQQSTTLAQRVDADRSTVAEMERQARERGVGLMLTRDELLQNLAEINQELVQPLTVSSALLQLLQSGRAGVISDAQSDLLKTASVSIDRLGTLISSLQSISGLPDELCPDTALLQEINTKR